MAAVPDTAPEEGTPVAETEAPAVEADTADTQETTDERPRNPDGTFAPKQQVVEEPETAAETQERLLAGKYRSADELERAHQELQSKLGEMGNELGQYRQWYEQQQGQQQPQQVPSPDALQEQLYENPHAIIPTIQQYHAAALRGDENAAYVRDTALATLRELSAVEAERYSRWVTATELQAQQEQQSHARTQQTQQWDQAAATFAQTHPDLNEFAPAMQELAQQSPAIVGLLGAQDPSVRLEVLDYLYTKAKASQADTLNAVREQVNAQTVEETDRAIQDAAVASSATTNPQNPNPTAEQALQERLRKAMPFAFGDEWTFSS